MLRDIHYYPDGSKRHTYADWTYEDYDQDGYFRGSGTLAPERLTAREKNTSSERDSFYAQNKVLDAFLDRVTSLLEEADNLVQTRGSVVSEREATEWRRKIRDVEGEVRRKRRPGSP